MNAHAETRNRSNPLPFVLLLALAAGLCWLVLPALANALPAAQVNTAPVLYAPTHALPFVQTQVIYHDHATTKHGADAEAVRKCLEDPKNRIEIWEKLNNSDRAHSLCILPDGRIGDMVTQLIDGEWHEASSFIRFEKTLQEVEMALGKEARMVWTALKAIQ